MQSKIKGTCHCGMVTFTLSAWPEYLVKCNCSICSRLGALWGHVDSAFVTVDAASGVVENATNTYSHGDKSLAFHHCKTCGCTTHWENLRPKESSRMAVNFRLCRVEDSRHFEVKLFDGADTWTFIK